MTDWKDIYQGLPREIRNAVSRSTQKDRKDPIKIYTERLERPYQGLPRQIGKTPIKVYIERLERHLSRSSKKDWKDCIKVYTERLERHLSRSSKTDWKDPIKVFSERLERPYHQYKEVGVVIFLKHRKDLHYREMTGSCV